MTVLANPQQRLALYGGHRAGRVTEFCKEMG